MIRVCVTEQLLSVIMSLMSFVKYSKTVLKTVQSCSEWPLNFEYREREWISDGLPWWFRTFHSVRSSHLHWRRTSGRPTRASVPVCLLTWCWWQVGTLWSRSCRCCRSRMCGTRGRRTCRRCLEERSSNRPRGIWLVTADRPDSPSARTTIQTHSFISRPSL